MKLFKKSLNRRKSSRPLASPASPPLTASSRRQSRDLTLVTHNLDQKRPSITMLPRDSGSSLPTSPSPTAVHRRLTSQGLYGPKRPNLEDILAGRSHRPWTLEAFTAWCDKNMCLENLHFIKEAEDYKRRYHNWFVEPHVPSKSTQSERLVQQWKDMLALYIAAGAQEEVNLSGDVREALLSVPPADLPADPHVLAAAVRLTHRLIEDSVLFAFLNDIKPDYSSDDEQHVEMVLSPKDEIRPKSYALQVESRGSRPSSRELSSPTSNPATYAPGVFGKRNSNISSSKSNRSNSRPKSTFSNAHSLSSGNESIDAALIDDSTASFTTATTTSHSNSRTPPMSPPISESDRPELRPRSDSGWRKFGARLGFGKKRSDSGLRSPRGGESAIAED